MTSNAGDGTNSSQNGTGPYYGFCTAASDISMLAAWLAIYLLCFPVFPSALYLLIKKQKESSGLSHSDIFTAQILAMEFINMVGSCVIFYGVYMGIRFTLVSLAICLCKLACFGQTFIHSLTCVERYLAVVHPITYLRLKKKGWLTIRNACIGSAWLLSIGLSALAYSSSLTFYHHLTNLLVTLIALAIVLFCTISALCVLIRPGPGEGDRKVMNHSKVAALNTMAFILGTQLLYIVGTILFVAMALFTFGQECLLSINVLWFQLPNSLVLPLLFLYREHKNIKT